MFVIIDGEDVVEDKIPLSTWLACFSSCSLLLLKAFFFLQVVSILEFSGARFTSEALPRIQEGENNLRTGYQFKESNMY